MALSTIRYARSFSGAPASLGLVPESAALPPAPWLLLQSRSEPGESFYFNPTTSEATWTLPAAPADATAEAEGALLRHELLLPLLDTPRSGVPHLLAGAPLLAEFPLS